MRLHPMDHMGICRCGIAWSSCALSALPWAAPAWTIGLRWCRDTSREYSSAGVNRKSTVLEGTSSPVDFSSGRPPTRATRFAIRANLRPATLLRGSS
jgi:hypothetical protein